jgi:hypothetical protein
MADRRLPSIAIRPGPYPQRQRVPNLRGPPPPTLRLPPISHFDQPPVGHPNHSHRYLIPTTPTTPAPQTGSSAQAHPLHAHDPATASTSNAPSPVPPWEEMHLRDLEVLARLESGEEKGKAFLGVWLGLHEVKPRDRQSTRLFVAKKLMPYPWFEGDETMREAARALQRLDYINYGLIAKSYNDHAMSFWDRKLGDGELTVREFWIEEGRKMKQKTQMQAQAKAQAHNKARAQDKAQDQAER